MTSTARLAPFISPASSSVPPLRIPPALAESCRASPERLAWLRDLPALVASLAHRWRLTIGAPFEDEQGSCAWVAPVTRHTGAEAVLKVALPHMEGADEIAGLRVWNGELTVHLLEADESCNAMLLERCRPGTPLRSLPEPEQDVILGDLLPRLWCAPPAGTHFRPLSVMLAHWAHETRATIDSAPDPSLVEAGLELFTELPASADDERLLFTDLHAGNVLRAERQPWLAIDPKPFVGDPAYDATQHLFNCLGRMRLAPLATIRSFAERLALPAERVRLWTFARAAAEPRGRWAHNPWLDIARRIAP